MSSHEYTPQQALELLIRKINEHDSQLATRVQEVFDAGKDVEEIEPSRGRSRKPRSYRKSVPYSYEEALRVAVGALEAYSIEQPLFVDSCLDNMAQVVLGEARDSLYSPFVGRKPDAGIDPKSKGQEKSVQIELRTGTQIEVRLGTDLAQRNQEVLPLQRIEARRVQEQRRHFEQLRPLIDFGAQ